MTVPALSDLQWVVRMETVGSDSEWAEQRGSAAKDFQWAALMGIAESGSAAKGDQLVAQTGTVE